MLIAPRFDSWGLAVTNAVTIAIFVWVLMIALRRRRAGTRIGWGWVAILVHVSIGGLYLPVGPLLWLATHRQEPDRVTARS